MRLDKPPEGGDHRPDRPERHEKPFPGAPLDRQPVAPPENGRSWDEIKAEKAHHDSQSGYDKAVIARQDAQKKTPADSSRPAAPDTDRPQAAKADKAPDSGDTAALRKRIAELEANNAGHERKIAAQDRKIASQDAKITKLELDKSELASELSGVRTELSERKAADTERDWKDRARDDKIADQAKDIEDLKATVGGMLKERTDKHPDAAERTPDNPGPDERTLTGEERESKAQKPERKLHLPSNAKITLVTSIIGEAAAADHVPTHTSDYVGIGVATASLGAAAVAAWREHRRKDSDDTNDRPGS